jgi:uncharacterized cupredoxin-like copper-binding protein/mono/diheme cytochrome c family protein
MQRIRRTTVVAVFGVCALGLGALLLGVGTGTASGHVQSHATAKVTVVTVTAGKPSELAFKLSKFSALPAGAITFKVKNAGTLSHDFKLCTTPVATSAKNACVGKVTKMLKAGQSTTLAVVLKKKGKYEYLCTVPGHAGAGMKGLLGIGVKVTAASSSSSATSSGSTGGGSSGGGSTGGGSTGGGSTGGGTTGGGGATVPTSFPPGNAGNGLTVFNTAGCAGCHALAAAGSPAGDGPTLDGQKLAVAAVEQQVVSGGGGMPPFGLQLTAQQIADVATFVSNSSQ